MSETVFDVIVVGSGAAGLSAALRAAELQARVGVLTAGSLLAGSSPRAQGGVAAALGADDAPALHAADTLAVGAGLNDASAVDVLTREGSRSVQHLLDDGVAFEDDLGLEAGHARRRIVHAGGGATGQVLTSALLERAAAQPRISLVDRSPVSGLELGDGRVVGVRVGHRRIRAGVVVLATGGYAALWGRSTNAPESRGSGLNLAWRAGASLADLEFVQFHPTALSVPGRPAFLLSEALRGEGARLVDALGVDVIDPLLPRDVVARALHRCLRRGRSVFLTLQHLDPARIHARFAGLSAALRTAFDGLDLARDLLPVAPAAHYCMGGVRTDTWGRTDVAGLYAAGEVACSGVQGANRLASNSLLECLVFGARAAEAALGDVPGTAPAWRTTGLDAQHHWPARSVSSVNTHTGMSDFVGSARSDVLSRDGLSLSHSGQAFVTGSPSRSEPSERASVGEDAWDADCVFTTGKRRLETLDAGVLGARLDLDLGVERDGRRLARLIADLPEPGPNPTAASDLLLAALIARAAWLRTESRGAHFRLDAPESDPTWRGRIHWRRAQSPVFEEVLA